jgi:hypothetical protein
MADLPCRAFGFAAAPALTEELQEMPVYLKAGLFRQPPLQSNKIAVGKIHDPSTVRANQVMVVFRGPSHQITAATTTGVHLTDEPKPFQHFQCTVNRHQTDAGMLPDNFIVYGCRR